MGVWHHHLARGAVRGCVVVALALVAVTGTGCGDEVEDINSWASEHRTGIFAKLENVGFCNIDFGAAGPTSVDLGIDHPVVSFLNVTFPAAFPKHERRVGLGTATVFFTDAPGYESAGVPVRYEIESGDAIPYEYQEGPDHITDRAFIIHRLVIDPIEVMHSPTGRTANVGGELRDVRIICGDNELGINLTAGE